MTAYRRLTLYDRQKIEEGLDAHLSFRKIAEMISRSPSTVSREVKLNRSRKNYAKKRALCRERKDCKVTGICKCCTSLPNTLCKTCPTFDCKGRCSVYREQISCKQLEHPPWVCNGCKKRSYGCDRELRMTYLAKVADVKSTEIRSEARQGFDMGKKKAEDIGLLVKECLVRGLSPYEISIALADRVEVSESTIYRLVNAGVGGCANIYLERKIRFKPRNHPKPRSETGHSKCFCYSAFLRLDVDRQAAATEMDTVNGKKTDSQLALTLYSRPTHLQIPLLLKEQTATSVIRALQGLKEVCPKDLFTALFETVLTDNGGEFADEVSLNRLFGGSAKDPHLYYCEPRRSDQKAACEKNHSELRQCLPKGKTPFDELDIWDMATVASHINSNPRKSLANKSPIQVFKLLYGSQAEELLEALGIEEVPFEALTLKPVVVDIERKKRGLDPINWK